MTDRLDAIREKRQRAYPANTLSHDEADWLIEQVASLRARVETAELEIAAAVAVFHGDPPIPNEMTLVKKVQNVLAQLSEARTKQAEAETDRDEFKRTVEQHEADDQNLLWKNAHDACEDSCIDLRLKLTEERTRREQAEQKAREATASAAVEMKARLHTEAERDTLQRDLDALRAALFDELNVQLEATPAFMARLRALLNGQP